MSLRTLSTRTLRAATAASPARAALARRLASTDTAVAAPMLANIEKRWETMPPQEQAELYMALRDRMRANWHELTLAEKRAAYWISFGPHGPRAEIPKGEGWRQFGQVAKYLAISGLVFWTIRQFANKEKPKTMTKEWQEMSNEYAKKEKLNPITGISSEGYTGKGFVQSK
ncbi:Cytochrome c oxidase subunit 5A [Ascosphaera acerosa]|nr:Cytochrome c oxidase subunit 5A [Ascosphaera acerosa]